MASRLFSQDPGLSDADLSGAQHQALATYALAYTCDTLQCTPYHRASKRQSNSDHQTPLRHSETGKVCLVLSVMPDPHDREVRVLGVDFFDRTESVSCSFGEILAAPRTQWTAKGERRRLAPKVTSSNDLCAFLAQLVGK
jgi:hypothetical protein